MWRFTFSLITLLSLSLFLSVKAQGYVNDEASRTTDELLQGYDKRFRPNMGGEPVKVGITAYILGLSKVDDKNNEFTIDMYFRQFWNDPRLKFTRKRGLDKLVLGDSSRFWVPDTFFVNEKESSLHDLTVKNEFFRILPNGDILKSIRTQAKFSCPMNLEYFPMDSQLCYIEIESFGFTMADLSYTWNDGMKNSVQISSDASVPEFKIGGHRLKTIEVSLSAGNYSRLAVEIQFERAGAYYVTTVCTPMAMIVIISFIQFWVDRTNHTSRTLISLITVLTISVMAFMFNFSMPKTTITRSIDVYTGISVTFTFMALVEYACVGFMERNVRDKMEFLGKKTFTRQESRKEFKILPSDVENFSRVFFPVAYAAFQLWFWITLTSARKDSVMDLIQFA